MMKYLIIIIITVTATLLFGNAASHVQAAYDQTDPFWQICKDTPHATVCEDKGAAQTQSDNRIYGKNGILMKATSIVRTAVGVASVIVLIIGGIKYITSGGDANAITSAKNTVLYAVVGLVITIAAQAIIVLVINKI